MASAVTAMPAVNAAPAAAFASSSVQSKELHSSFSSLTFIDGRAVRETAAAKGLCVSRTVTARAMQSRMIKERLMSGLVFRPRDSTRVGRVRAATEGPQTAQPDVIVSEPAKPSPTAPVEAAATKPGDEGKSTFDIVREVISDQLAVAISEVEPHTKFADLGADSLDTVEIMMSLEDRFSITIEEDGTEKIATVKDAADLIDQVKNK